MYHAGEVAQALLPVPKHGRDGHALWSTDAARAFRPCRSWPARPLGGRRAEQRSAPPKYCAALRIPSSSRPQLPITRRGSVRRRGWSRSVPQRSTGTPACVWPRPHRPCSRMGHGQPARIYWGSARVRRIARPPLSSAALPLPSGRTWREAFPVPQSPYPRAGVRIVVIARQELFTSADLHPHHPAQSIGLGPPPAKVLVLPPPL